MLAGLLTLAPQAVNSARTTLMSSQEQLQQGEEPGPKAPLPVGAGAIKFVSKAGNRTRPVCACYCCSSLCSLLGKAAPPKDAAGAWGVSMLVPRDRQLFSLTDAAILQHLQQTCKSTVIGPAKGLHPIGCDPVRAGCAGHAKDGQKATQIQLAVLIDLRCNSVRPLGSCERVEGICWVVKFMGNVACVRRPQGKAAIQAFVYQHLVRTAFARQAAHQGGSSIIKTLHSKSRKYAVCPKASFA